MRETDVPETEGVLFLFLCYCVISFEWCVGVQPCSSLFDDSSGVCVWVGGWVDVYGYVWRRAWQKGHVFSWDIVLIIELCTVCV